MLDPVGIWNMAKRYVAGAIFGLLVTMLAAWGIHEATNPELFAQLRILVDALLMAVFYVAAILFKSWRQKKVLEKGDVLPERIEAASTAKELGVPLKLNPRRPPLGTTINP